MKSETAQALFAEQGLPRYFLAVNAALAMMGPVMGPPVDFGRISVRSFLDMFSVA
jgi:hypothetical protein